MVDRLRARADARYRGDILDPSRLCRAFPSIESLQVVPVPPPP